MTSRSAVHGFSGHLSKRVHGNAVFSMVGGEASLTSRALLFRILELCYGDFQVWSAGSLAYPPGSRPSQNGLRRALTCLTSPRRGGGLALGPGHRGASSVNVKVLCFVTLIKVWKAYSLELWLFTED